MEAWPGGGRGVSCFLLPPKPDKPLKKHQQGWESAWSSGLARIVDDWDLGWEQLGAVARLHWGLAGLSYPCDGRTLRYVLELALSCQPMPRFPQSVKY